MRFKHAVSMILMVCSTGFSVNALAGRDVNQPALMEAIRQCDGKMTSIVLRRGGVEIKRTNLLGTAIYNLLEGEADDRPETKERIASCLSTIDVLLEHGVLPNWFSDNSSADAMDFLVDRVANAAGPGWPANDKKRMNTPENHAVRGVKALKILASHGYDFRKPLLPIYIGSNSKIIRKFAQVDKKEDANLLMKLAANTEIHKAAALVASNENPYVGSMMFFAWVLHESDVNATNSNGKTALMFAAGAGNSANSSAAVIVTLLEKGADKNFKGKDGKTALDYALAAGDNKAAKLLM